VLFSINVLKILAFFIGLHGLNTGITDGRGQDIKKQNP
jgi:hypothetical protein